MFANFVPSGSKGLEPHWLTDLAPPRPTRRTHKPNIPLRNARGFERWFNEDGRTWPGWLYQLGRDCTLVLHMIPGQERCMKNQNKTFAGMVERIVTAFKDGYAAYKSGRA